MLLRVLNNNSQRANFILRALILNYTVMHAFWFQCTVNFHAQPCLDLKSFLDNMSKNPYPVLVFLSLCLMGLSWMHHVSPCR